MNDRSRIDFAELKARWPILTYCESRGIQLKRCGSSWAGKCPLHRERKGMSFSVWQDGRWQCFGSCAKGGDVIDLELALGGGTLPEAIERLGGAPIDYSRSDNAEQPAKEKPRPTADNPLLLPYVLSDDQLRLCTAAAGRLASSIELIRKVTEWRKWSEATIRELALEGSLGIDGDDRLAFIYDTGLKTRRRRNGEREIRWSFGKPWFWRGAFIRDARTVYVCEGETDAITLIDSGIQSDGETCVIALPCANFKADPWDFLFSRKRLVIATDDDQAGQKAANQLVNALGSVASTMERLDVGGLVHG